jgi:hypothetical protein
LFRHVTRISCMGGPGAMQKSMLETALKLF